MRNELGKFSGTTMTVIGTVKRYGCRIVHDHWKEMVLLVDVQRLGGSLIYPLADQLWMNAAKTVCSLGAVTGDTISFVAKVAEYRRFDGSLAYHLTYPRAMEINASNPLLFPEETERNPGDGVAAAIKADRDGGIVRPQRFDRKAAIEKLRAAAADRLICIPSCLQDDYGAGGVHDDELAEMLQWIA